MEKTITDYIKEGLELEQAGQPQDALICYDKAIALDPYCGEAYFRKGFINEDPKLQEEEIGLYKKAISLGYATAQCYYCMGVTLKVLHHDEESVEANKKAIELKPDYSQAYDNMGVCLTRLGRLEEAVEAYMKILDEFKEKKPEIWAHIGAIYEALGNKDEALKNYDIAMSKNSHKGALYKADLLNSEQKYEEAVSLYSKALEWGLQVPETYYGLGNAYKGLGNGLEAKAAYTEGTKLIAANFMEHHAKGKCLVCLGMKEEANVEFLKTKAGLRNPTGAFPPLRVKEVKATLNSIPINARLLAMEVYQEGIEHEKAKRLEEALKCYDKAIELDPSYGEAYFRKGFINEDPNLQEEEIELYIKAISLGYTTAQCYYCMGVTMKVLHRDEESIAANQKAIELKPNYWQAYDNMGVCLTRLGRLEEATEAYLKVIEYNTNKIEMWAHLGALYEGLGRKEQAIENYDISISKGSHKGALYKGDLLVAERKYEEAIPLYLKALEWGLTLPETYYGLGNAYRGLGNEEEAVKAFRKGTMLSSCNFMEYYAKGQCFVALGMEEEARSEFTSAQQNLHKAVGAFPPDKVKAVKATLASFLKIQED